MFYLTHLMYGYMAREETRCRHMGYSFRINMYHPTALAGTRNSSLGPP